MQVCSWRLGLVCFVLLSSGGSLACTHEGPAEGSNLVAGTSEKNNAPPATVIYTNGQLTIVANNAVLSDILHAIQEKTGAAIDLVAGVEIERVAGSFGPGDPASVIASLLNGTRFNYVLLGSSNPASLLSRVLLSVKPPQTMDTAGAATTHKKRRLAEVAAVDPSPTDPVAPDSNPSDAASPPSPGRTAADLSRDNGPSTTAADSSAEISTSDPSTNAQVSVGALGIAWADSQAALAADVPANILKAIQRPNSGDPNSSRPASFGPAPSTVGSASGSAPVSGPLAGDGIALPRGGAFFNGFISVKH